MKPALTVPTGFVAWSRSLHVLMATIGSTLVVTKSVSANGSCPGNSNWQKASHA
jgi:hypothetical protein